MGLIPAFEKDDFKLTESAAIASYIASFHNKTGLAGVTKEDAASVLQWTAWANIHLLVNLGGWFRPLSGKVPYNKTAVDAAKATVFKLCAYLEKCLSDKTFLVGHRITLADIYVASVLVRGFEFVLDAEFRTAHPNIFRHFNTVVNQPHFAAVLGASPTLIEKCTVYTPPKKEPAAPKVAAPAAAKAPKAPKPKDDDEDEPSVPDEPKAKHPAEALGAAKAFPLDEFKRQYSNNETPVAMKWLEGVYDPSEYSLWRVDYKYPTELTQVFMSANLIGGFHNRLEGSRKYLFGSAGVYGVTNDSEIVGVYMIRGQDHVGVFDVAPDWESYSYSPLDIKADRELIEGCWSWTNSINGKPYADGKAFK